ncbi:MAG: hypothetical protein MHPSP_002484, partial [Paramarteilia canceri]
MRHKYLAIELSVDRLLSGLVKKICRKNDLEKCRGVIEIYPFISEKTILDLFESEFRDLDHLVEYLSEYTFKVEEKSCNRDPNSLVQSLKVLSYEACLLYLFDLHLIIATIYQSIDRKEEIIGNRFYKMASSLLDEMLSSEKNFQKKAAIPQKISENTFENIKINECLLQSNNKRPLESISYSDALKKGVDMFGQKIQIRPNIDKETVFEPIEDNENWEIEIESIISRKLTLYNQILSSSTHKQDKDYRTYLVLE